MHALRAAIAQRPIPAFIVIAFAFSWAFTLLVSVSIAFGLIALFGPAVAAVVVSWADGTLGEIRTRIADWRQPVGTYLAAVGIPFAVAAAGAAVLVAAGGSWTGFGGISAIEIVIFVLVIGEETGWRGFLQPRLRARMSLVAASVVTGVVWIAWHLPMYLGAEQGLAAFALFAWWVLPLAIVMGFVAERARYSIVVATFMHGAANIAAPIVLPGVDHDLVLLVTGALYWLAAVGLVMRERSRVGAARSISRARLVAAN
jgi:CDP-diacylglycerol--glycerol-3-phosphate 3-phosphatidyltransferase